MKKLLYIDTFSTGSFHETFNASSLKMMSLIFNNIEYYSTKSSCAAVYAIMEKVPDNITYRKINLINFNGRIGRFLHLLSSFCVSIYFIIYVLNKEDIAFFNYNTHWATPFINWYCKFSKKKIILMCHGELEFLLTKTRCNFITNKVLHWFTLTDVKIAKTLYFCVAGESIINNLHLAIAEQIIPHFISFEHTYISHNRQGAVKKKFKILRVGTVGTIRQFKGLNNILKIGAVIKDNPNIEFYVIGRVFCDVRELAQYNIKYIPNSDQGFVSKSILNSYIDSMDVLIFVYPVDHYKLTASGAIFDSMDREKYILSLHNDYFDSIFARVSIGKQFHTIDELINFVTNLKEVPNLNYKIIRDKLSPESEAQNFKYVLEKLF